MEATQAQGPISRRLSALHDVAKDLVCGRIGVSVRRLSADELDQRKRSRLERRLSALQTQQSQIHREIASVQKAILEVK